MNYLVNLLVIIHIAVWLYVLFGGLISEKFCKINLFILIPLIYLIHIMSFHIFVIKKITLINNNYDQYLLNSDISTVNDIDFKFFKNDHNFLKNLNSVPEDRKDNIIKIYILEENKYILPVIYRRLRYNFTNSFGDPLSHQGMLILGYIINVYLLKFSYQKI